MPKFPPKSKMLIDWNKLESPKRTARTIARRLHPSKVSEVQRTFATTYTSNQYTSDTDQIPYWRSLGPWKDVHADDFLNYGWQVRQVNNAPSSTILTFDIRKQTRSSGQTSF